MRARRHLSLEKDAPVQRPATPSGRVVAIPEVNGLHHRYTRVAAWPTRTLPNPPGLPSFGANRTFLLIPQRPEVPHQVSRRTLAGGGTIKVSRRTANLPVAWSSQ
jgi:hypothetical protein